MYSTDNKIGILCVSSNTRPNAGCACLPLGKVTLLYGIAICGQQRFSQPFHPCLSIKHKKVGAFLLRLAAGCAIPCTAIVHPPN
jgi:hypothetical protein